LSVADPAGILAAIGIEIEDEIRKMLHGQKDCSRVTALACGAAALRNHAPTAREWVAATALLRSPVAQRPYLNALEFCDERRRTIERIAKVLCQEGKLTSAEVLWLGDQPTRLAS
jgi:hypothetical protein